ncbi:MAG: TIGR02996 domain-containing protein [Proteobacteria bacterium]|nr:TIGR02996 domain-containing protein [Pseudomonadota bacterium]
MPPTTEQQLRQQIWSDPTDRQLLSVYADWLATTGDKARAEFVQLSLLPKRTSEQAKRLTALRNKHRGAWLGAARPFIYTWEEDEDTPGFVRRCQCQMAKLTTGFEQVRGLGPRLVVSVTAPKAKRETIALSKLPLGTLWGLAFYEADAQWITDELMTTLAPAMHGLRELVLHAEAARASDRGFATILDHIASVEHLDLTIGWNPERWLELLIDRQLPLKTLSLPGWIKAPMRRRLAKVATQVTYRSGEGYHRYDRETGYYTS